MSIQIKNPDDVVKMRVAGRLASEVLDFITPHVKPGVSTEQMVLTRSYYLRLLYQLLRNM